MLLSNVTKKMGIPCEILNEREFSSLGLISAKSNVPLCSFIDSDKFIDNISSSIVMILVNKELAIRIPKTIGVCICDNPRAIYFMMHNYLAKQEDYRRKKIKTEIDSSSRIASSASICENNVFVGNNVLIEENCVIRANVTIGNNSIVRAGSIIGGVGFEFKRDDDRIWAVEHLGGVKIGDNVEIQYNCCIDRAIYPWEDTVIGDYCKIDNLVHIAHGVKMERCVMVVAKSGIGGRVEIGANSWIGFDTTIRNGITVGENARANMGAVVTKCIPDNGSVTGNFAIEHEKFMKSLKERA